MFVGRHSPFWRVFTFFKWSDRVPMLLVEWLLVLPHPVRGLEGKTVSLFQTFDEIYLKHSYNDLLSLLLMAKVYIIIRALINITAFSSPRASRLCYQNGFEHSTLYIIKCILHEHPLTAIGLNFLMCVVVFGYGLKLSEGLLFLYNPGLSTGF